MVGGGDGAGGRLGVALLVAPVRSGVYYPGSFRSAGQQKLHHPVRIKASGVNPESNVR